MNGVKASLARGPNMVHKDITNLTKLESIVAQLKPELVMFSLDQTGHCSSPRIAVCSIFASRTIFILDR